MGHAPLQAGEDATRGIPEGCVPLPVDTIAEAGRIFGALAEVGEVQMALQETFWARRFGMLTHRYGKAWMVSCPKPPCA